MLHKQKHVHSKHVSLLLTSLFFLFFLFLFLLPLSVPFLFAFDVLNNKWFYSLLACAAYSWDSRGTDVCEFCGRKQTWGDLDQTFGCKVWKVIWDEVLTSEFWSKADVHWLFFLLQSLMKPHEWTRLNTRTVSPGTPTTCKNPDFFFLLQLLLIIREISIITHFGNTFGLWNGRICLNNEQYTDISKQRLSGCN